MLHGTSALPSLFNPDSVPSPALASKSLLDSSLSPNYVPLADCHNSPPCAGLSGAAGDSLARLSPLDFVFVAASMTS